MNKSNNTGKVLYVQLGRDETRLALLGGPESPSMILPTPAGAVGDGVIQNLDTVRAMLKNALQEPAFKSCRRVVFSLCTSQVITETVATPQLPAKQLERLLLSNVDVYFPVDMQEYKMVWQVIGPKGGDSNEQLVQLWAVPMSMLSRYYQVANACDLVVERIDYCGNSIATAIGASFAQPAKPKQRAKLSLKTEISFGKKKKEEQETTVEEPVVRQQADTQLHIYMENDLLGVTFVQNRQIMMQRFIRCGANPTHQFDELAMMVEYYSSMEMGRGSAITGFISGGLAENAAVVAELVDTLGISVQMLESDYEPKWIMCVGAAAGTLEFGIPTMNVMKPVHQVGSQLWQYVLMLATGLVLVGAVLLLLTSRMGWEAKMATLKSQQTTLLVQVKQTSGYADKYNKYVSEYNKYSSDWDAVFDNLRTYNDNLLLAFEELEAALPENTSVTSLQISETGLTVQFACSSKEEAAYLIMALRKLNYMDLVSISSLSGGGGGPVTSYGPQGGTTETPPTEGDYGSLTEQEVKMLAQLLAINVDQAQMMNVIMSLDDEELALLEEVYGKKPDNHYPTLKMLRAAYQTKDIFQQRSDALHEMLTTNPFVVRKFVDLVMEDVWAPEPILLWEIYDDLMLPENSDMLDMIMGDSQVTDATQAFEMMERLIVILTKDEAKLTATEDLLCTDGNLERWYLYYLEMELGLQEKSVLGFLDMDRVLTDLMEGSFDTGNADLDKKLNALIPQEVLDALELIKDSNNSGGNGGGNNGGNDDPIVRPEKPGPDDYTRMELMGFLFKYIENGKSGDDYIDQLIKNYLETGTTGDERWDAFLEPYEKYLKREDNGEIPNPVDPNGKKPSDYQQAELMSMLYKYMNTGSTGDAYLDGLIDNYLLTGSTGDKDWDAFLEPYKQYLFPDSGNNNGGGNGGNSGKYPYYITISFKYNDALKNAELDRKGLDEDAKIEKVEVFG